MQVSTRGLATHGRGARVALGALHAEHKDATGGRERERASESERERERARERSRETESERESEKPQRVGLFTRQSGNASWVYTVVSQVSFTLLMSWIL